MKYALIALCLTLPGTSSFMIHNTLHSLCLEDSNTTGLVQLRTCSPDSDLQQWWWKSPSVLECVATSRCLSGLHADPVQTVPCEGGGEGGDGSGLQWDCERNRLISLKLSLDLSTDGKRLTLSERGKQTKWRSPDEGDICQDRLRSKRASGEPEEFEVREEGQERSAGPAAMTEEQREYLRWYYRTEDPTTWTFVMLGLAFGSLLLGCLLLGMGSMANKSRKKIAKYKAAAALARRPEAEELQVIAEVTEHTEVKATYSAPTQVSSPSESLVQENKQPKDNGAAEGLKPGDIVVTWKNGDVSNLYAEPELEEPQREEVQEEEVGKEEEEGKEEEVEAEVEVEAELKVEAETAALMEEKEGQ